MSDADPAIGKNPQASWRQVAPSIYLWPDSCNVYAIIGPSGRCVLVDAGTGEWVDHVDALPAPPAALLCTHFFRDHSAGAAKAGRELGLPIYVPEREIDLFRDPAEHFRNRSTYVVYSNYWDHFAPIEPIHVTDVVRDYQRLEVAGIEIEAVPLPGATVNQVGFAFTVPGTELRAICSGETVHSPGRVPRVAPLQYDYNDLLGAVEVHFASQDLRRRGFDILLPSMGTPILHNVDQALEQVSESMTALCANRPIESGMIASKDQPELVRVTDHVWYSAKSGSATWFLLGEDGTALALDYGYHDNRVFQSLPLSVAHRKRPLAHSLEALRNELGVSRIDVVIPSHFHDDHVAGISMLQRLQGTKCWAPDTFADLLAQPSAHAFPCDWPEPMVVDRRIGDGEEADWQSFRFQFAPMSGHTRFASLIAFEADGLRFAHTGDQYSFFTSEALDRHAEESLPMTHAIRDWSDLVAGNNHVYRNGALLDGYRRSGQWLREWRPSVVISGHWPPFMTDDAFFELIDRRSRDYEDLHQAAMPLSQDDVHFGLDSWGGWLWPYRLHLRVGETRTVQATVRNPLPVPATLEVQLVGPGGWRGSSESLDALPHAETTCSLQITPSAECRRQPIAVELRANGRPFGQVAEAIVTVGGSRW